MTDSLRKRLIDHIARLPVHEIRSLQRTSGVITIVADDMADALLPFIVEEMAAELEGLADDWSKKFDRQTLLRRANELRDEHSSQ